MTEDPLERLLVTQDEVNREMLAEVLAPYVKIAKESGSIVQLPAFGQLTNAEKILIFLLARKAAKSLGVKIEREEVSPKEISNMTGINYDSVKPTVSALAKKRILHKAGELYFVPGHAVLTVKEMLPLARRPTGDSHPSGSLVGGK
jgi:hypothetical protein